MQAAQRKAWFCSVKVMYGLAWFCKGYVRVGFVKPRTVKAKQKDERIDLMYTPNEELELWNKRNKYFSEGSLYICKEDIKCEHGVFNKGTLVKVRLCGTNSDFEDMGVYDNTMESVQEIFTHFKHCFLRISDMDDFYSDYNHEGRMFPSPRVTDTCKVTIDNIDELVCLFEHQKELEYNIAVAKEIVSSYRDKSEDYDANKWLFLVLGLLIAFIFSVVGAFFFKTLLCTAFIAPVATVIGLGIVSAVICSHKAEKYINMAYNTERKSVGQCYNEWKSTR